MRKNVKKILKKNYPIFVIEMSVGELIFDKCSKKFLAHNFPNDEIVFVKCYENGEIDFRGKREEYRIIPNKCGEKLNIMCEIRAYEMVEIY